MQILIMKTTHIMFITEKSESLDIVATGVKKQILSLSLFFLGGSKNLSQCEVMCEKTEEIKKHCTWGCKEKNRPTL